MLRNLQPNIIYLNNNTQTTEGVPAHLQRYMVYEYCKKNDIAYDFELFELETMNHLPTLDHILKDLRCNAILYSIYSLPESSAERAHIFDSAIDSGVVLYFVNEDLVVHDDADRSRVEALLGFAKHGDDAGRSPETQPRTSST